MKTTNLTPKPSKPLTEYTKEELVNECLTLQEKVKDLAQKQEWLIEQIRLANQKKFGSSSEKTEYPDGYEQICLAFNEAEKFADSKVKEPEFEEVTIKRKKTKGKREADLAGLETETIEYTLPIEGQVCPNCEQTLHVMSKEVRKELVVIPRHLKVVEHVSYIYACRNCEKNDITTPIIKVAAPKPVIKGSVASPSLVALVMENKCEKHWGYVA